MRQNRRNTVHPHEVREQTVKLMSELNFTPKQVSQKLGVPLKTNECIHTTLEQPLGIDTPHLDQILPMMQETKRQDLGCKQVTVIDREGDVAKETLVLWYYYRWNIEDYFKLLKSGGHEMEHWQQESGLAILKRLLVVSMGLSLVWSLRASESPEAKEFKKLLVRLSGKSQQRGKPATAGTLLSGLFVLLMIFDFLEMMDYDAGKINKVRNLLANFLPE